MRNTFGGGGTKEECLGRNCKDLMYTRIHMGDMPSLRLLDITMLLDMKGMSRVRRSWKAILNSLYGFMALTRIGDP